MGEKTRIKQQQSRSESLLVWHKTGRARTRFARLIQVHLSSSYSYPLLFFCFCFLLFPSLLFFSFSLSIFLSFFFLPFFSSVFEHPNDLWRCNERKWITVGDDYCRSLIRSLTLYDGLSKRHLAVINGNKNLNCFLRIITCDIEDNI